MTRRRSLPLLLLATVLALCLAAPGAARYPTAAGVEVNDYAGVLSRSEAARLRALAGTLRAESGIELAVVSIESYEGYGTGDRGFEQFANGLFDAWEVGDRWRNDGVLLLLGVEDRAVRIELGDGYRGLDDEMRQIVDDQVMPEIRRNRHGEALVIGVEALTAQLPWLARDGGRRRAVSPETVAPPRAAAPRAPVPRPSGPPAEATAPSPEAAVPLPEATPLRSDSGSGGSAEDDLNCGTVFGMIMAFIVVVGWLLGYLMRSAGIDAQNKAHHCPMCQGKLKKKWRPLRRPTEHSTGKARFTRTCEECGWNEEKSIVLPKESSGDETSPSS